MIRSMTAFARAEHSAGGFTATVEVRTVNHRYCEVVIRMPRAYWALEERIRGLVRSKIDRGRVEVSVETRDLRTGNVGFTVSEDLARAYWEAFSRLKDMLGATDALPLASLIRLEGVVKADSKPPDPDQDWDVIGAAAREAVATLETMRQAEGRALHQDFLNRLKLLEIYLDRVEEESRDLPALQRARFAERIQALVKGNVPLDPARLAQEAAIYADKSDITEELVRARSHVAQFHSFLKQEEPAGRSLNFLVQEMHREFNTMGSKSSSATLSHLVVEAKSEVEKIKEQIQNVE
jgi:uncharacterized protein (TIGR00255 family)